MADAILFILRMRNVQCPSGLFAQDHSAGSMQIYGHCLQCPVQHVIHPIASPN